ncbi:MAG TPA: CsbD family protein [Chloroflexota bacterium]|nr:CsbD family protein [Chloroflexota bacterium]
MAETDAMKDKVQGKLHEVKGAATGNKGEELKGKLQGAKGEVEHNVNKPQREDVRDEANQLTP